MLPLVVVSAMSGIFAFYNWRFQRKSDKSCLIQQLREPQAQFLSFPLCLFQCWPHGPNVPWTLLPEFMPTGKGLTFILGLKVNRTLCQRRKRRERKERYNRNTEVLQTSLREHRFGGSNAAGQFLTISMADGMVSGYALGGWAFKISHLTWFLQVYSSWTMTTLYRSNKLCCILLTSFFWMIYIPYHKSFITAFSQTHVKFTTGHLCKWPGQKHPKNIPKGQSVNSKNKSWKVFLSWNDRISWQKFKWFYFSICHVNRLLIYKSLI